MQRGAKTVQLPVTLGKLEDEKTETRAPASDTTPESSGGLGLQVGDAPGGGAVVRRVAPDGLAAGSLEPGDVILELNRQPVSSASDLVGKTRATAPSKPLVLRVKREGVTRYVVIERAK